MDVLVHDPLGDSAEAMREYRIALSPLEAFKELDILILAVPHRDYLTVGAASWSARLKPNGVLIDVKSVFTPRDFSPPLAYWGL
jgi:UDP-N-acetyl-D-galactosamine dehydrogenase